jgi:hypothetical protein
MKPVDDHDRPFSSLHRALQWLPFKTAIDRWSRKSRLAKRINIHFFNLPEVAKTHFSLVLYGKRNQGNRSLQYRLEFVRNLLTVAKETFELSHAGIAGALVSRENYQAKLSNDNLEALYRMLRIKGFVHFETDDQIDVSWDPNYYYSTSYEALVDGNRYWFHHSTERPLTKLWEKEARELEDYIDDLALVHRTGLPFRHQPSSTSDN